MGPFRHVFVYYTYSWASIRGSCRSGGIADDLLTGRLLVRFLAAPVCKVSWTLSCSLLCECSSARVDRKSAKEEPVHLPFTTLERVLFVSESVTTWTWLQWTSWGRGATSLFMLKMWRGSDSVTLTVSIGTTWLSAVLWLGKIIFSLVTLELAVYKPAFQQFLPTG